MFTKIAQLNTTEKFVAYLQSREIDLPFLPELPAPEELALGRPIAHGNKTVGNRWSILPMEGWDCEPDGRPSELTRRRWLRFGQSGAKILFGCEAAAVMESGKSNTRQLMIDDRTVESIADLRAETVRTHEAAFRRTDDLLIGLQLTHSGRYSHPHDDAKLESVIAYRNPTLDARFGNAQTPVASDAEIDEMIERFVHAGRLASEAGFDFVDVKTAHGYFGHEILSAYDRPGKYGGTLENRSRFFREIAAGIKRVAPNLEIALRFSLFDFVPFQKGPDGVGVPMFDEGGGYRHAFGGDGTGLGYDLTEPFAFIDLIRRECGVRMVCATLGSPYYNPHLQRPASFPVFDGYTTPWDPLRSVALHIRAAAEFKKRFPDILLIGSGYSYLQDWLPNVAEAAVAQGMVDCVGIGRMVLSYPQMGDDVLRGRPLDRKRICRTLGDCTNAPRRGMVSGCYPLDDFYKARPEAEKLRELKRTGGK